MRLGGVSVLIEAAHVGGFNARRDIGGGAGAGIVEISNRAKGAGHDQNAANVAEQSEAHGSPRALQRAARACAVQSATSCAECPAL